MDFEKKHDVDDAAKVCADLKDVITRLIFKDAQYGGTYQSPMVREFSPQPISWVQPVTAAEKLGFRLTSRARQCALASECLPTHCA